mgnify:CR=1 FL=1
MANAEKHWYVLKAIGGKEKKAKEALDAEVKRRGLEDLVTQTVVPVEKVYVQRNGKKVVKENVLYSGYVFVECALIGEVAAVISNVPNVIGFLAEGGKPNPMRASEVSRMIGRVDELIDDNNEVDIPYFVGENVKVIDGPFNNFTGTIEQVDEEKKKLSVTVKIFGRNTPLELNYYQVEKIS